MAVTIAGDRVANLGLSRRSGPLSREGSLSCHTYCDTGPRFIPSHPKDRHPCPTVGFEPQVVSRVKGETVVRGSVSRTNT
jgi:hypothetical protein